MTPAPTDPKKSPDLSGRDRFGRNVAFAWGGYLVNVVSGFVVPRLISDQLGQTTLGIWDFCWSIVSYFGLVQLGLGGSVARYVAKYRAEENVDGLNRSVSTVTLFLRSVGWLAALVAVLVAWLVLPLFADRLGEGLNAARWVVLFLGLEIATGITLTVYGSVIVGCHRWDIHNSVSAICYGIVATGMITALMSGAGLPVLAAIHFVAMTAGQLARRYLSRRVCPELVIDCRLARWSIFAEQARYSFKSMAPRVASLLSNQAQAILITIFLGPASLAIFARPRSLMTTLQTLAVKFGMILIPTTSALNAQNNRDGLRESLLGRSAAISALTLPVVVTLSVFGDLIIRFWMGPTYVYPGLVAILSIGCFATLAQEPVWALLSGMNAHGKMAVAKLVAACGSAVLLALGLGVFGWGLTGAAVCFSLPSVLIDGLLTPWYACRLLGVPRRKYAWEVYLIPALCAAPLSLGMLLGVRLLPTNPVWGAAAFFVGFALTAAAYFRWVLPGTVIRRISKLACGLGIRRATSPCP